MKDDAPTGPTCGRCGSPVVICRDDVELCNSCSPLNRAGPGSVALRGMRAVAELRRRGRGGIYAMTEER